MILRGLTDVKNNSNNNGTTNHGPTFGVEGVLREVQSTLSEELWLAMTILRAEEDRAAAAAAEVYTCAAVCFLTYG